MSNIRLVIAFVGATVLVALCLIGYLAGTSDRPIPDVLQNVAIGALTGLVGLLVPSGSSSR